MLKYFLLGCFWPIFFSAFVKGGEAQNLEFIDAISRGDYDEFNRLFESGVDPNLITPDEYCGHVLVQKGTHIAILAFENDHHLIFSRLLPRFSYIDSQYGTKLMKLLVEKQRIRSIHFVLNSSQRKTYYDVTTGNTPIHYIARNDNIDLITLFDQFDMVHNSPNAFGWTPLMIAKACNAQKTYEYLMKKGFSMSKPEEEIALFYSALKNEEVALTLVNREKLLNKFDFTGNSFLTAIIWSGRAVALGAIPNEKVNWDIKSKDGHQTTPLIYASIKEKDVALSILLSKGAKFDMQMSDGNTALIFAATLDNLNQVQSLVDHGANVNIANFLGTTPLFSAVANQNAKMVEILIQAGANVNSPVCNGATAISLARNLSNQNIIYMLEQALLGIEKKTFTHK